MTKYGSGLMIVRWSCALATHFISSDTVIQHILFCSSFYDGYLLSPSKGLGYIYIYIYIYIY